MAEILEFKCSDTPDGFTESYLENIQDSFSYDDLINSIDTINYIQPVLEKLKKHPNLHKTLDYFIQEYTYEEIAEMMQEMAEEMPPPDMMVPDSEVSQGQYSPGKYVVFVEMSRRTSVPERIVEIVEDLETLTDLSVKDWTIKIDDKDYACDAEQLKKVLVLSPHNYRKEKETDLNEMRELSGMKPRTFYTDKKDSLLKDFISKAGL